MFQVTGGDDLNDPVRRAGAASVCELLRVAYDAYIRLNRIIPVMKQFDGKWAGIYLAGVAVGVNIISDGE